MIDAAVLGSPIGHSLSPLLHNVAYKHLGVQGQYEAIEVKSGQLSEFLSTTQKDVFSLTMPLKEEALGVAHDVSQIAKKISGGNTLVRSGTGWNLTSTDVEGFKYALLAHGISKALVAFDYNTHFTLRSTGFLTRDSRVVERKKYGYKKARKGKTYRKR